MARLEAREKEEADLARELGSREKDSEDQQGRLKAASTSLVSLESSIEDRRGEIVHRISKIAALNNFLQAVLANSEKVSAELFKLEAEVAEVDLERARLEKASAEAESRARERARQARAPHEGARSARERAREEALRPECPRPRARPRQGRAFRTSGPLVFTRRARRRPGSFRSGGPPAPHARKRERRFHSRVGRRRNRRRARSRASGGSVSRLRPAAGPRRKRARRRTGPRAPRFGEGDGPLRAPGGVVREAGLGRTFARSFPSFALAASKEWSVY